MFGRAHLLANTLEHQQYPEDHVLRATSRLNYLAAQTLGQQTKLLLYPRPPASPRPAPALVHGPLEIQLLRLREVALATTSLGHDPEKRNCGPVPLPAQRPHGQRRGQQTRRLETPRRLTGPDLT